MTINSFIARKGARYVVKVGKGEETGDRRCAQRRGRHPAAAPGGPQVVLTWHRPMAARVAAGIPWQRRTRTVPNPVAAE